MTTIDLPRLMLQLWSMELPANEAALRHPAALWVPLAGLLLRAAAVAALAWSVRRRPPHGSRLAQQLMLTLLLNGAYLGLACVPAGTALPAALKSLALATQPLAMLLLLIAFAFQGECPPARRYAGAAIATIGIGCSLAAASGGGAAMQCRAVGIVAALGAITGLLAGAWYRHGLPSPRSLPSAGFLQRIGGLLAALASMLGILQYRGYSASLMHTALAWSAAGLALAVLAALARAARRHDPAAPLALLLALLALLPATAWALAADRLDISRFAAFVLALAGTALQVPARRPANAYLADAQRFGMG